MSEKHRTDDQSFWLEIRALLISLVCLIERRKLKGIVRHTTAELRDKEKKERRVSP